MTSRTHGPSVGHAGAHRLWQGLRRERHHGQQLSALTPRLREAIAHMTCKSWSAPLKATISCAVRSVSRLARSTIHLRLQGHNITVIMLWIDCQLSVEQAASSLVSVGTSTGGVWSTGAASLKTLPQESPGKSAKAERSCPPSTLVLPEVSEPSLTHPLAGTHPPEIRPPDAPRMDRVVVEVVPRSRL